MAAEFLKSLTRALSRRVALAAICAAVSLSASAASLVSPPPKLQFFDNTGAFCSGCKLFTYQGGSTTKQTTATDSTGGTPNANPTILNTRGEANVWLTPGQTYKYVLAPSTDSDPPTNPFWTVDQVLGGSTPWQSYTPVVTCLTGLPMSAYNIIGSYTKSADGKTVFFTVNIAVGLRIWLGPFDITDACRLALDRITKDLSHA
jgi:hypothetical protein